MGYILVISALLIIISKILIELKCEDYISLPIGFFGIIGGTYSLAEYFNVIFDMLKRFSE